jgi:hypothetical protein
MFRSGEGAPSARDGKVQLEAVDGVGGLGAGGNSASSARRAGAGQQRHGAADTAKTALLCSHLGPAGGGAARRSAAGARAEHVGDGVAGASTQRSGAGISSSPAQQPLQRDARPR